MNDEIEEIDEYREPQRIPTTQQRVALMRAMDTRNFKKTIELKLSLDEVKILDALASKEGMSRILFASMILKDIIFKSGYFLSGDRLVSPVR